MSNQDDAPDKEQQDGGKDNGKNSGGNDDSSHDEQELGDLLQELRVLQQGVQVLTAFLVILPFNQGFDKVNQEERWVYLATFVCSMTALVLLSAPAAQHRLARPLMDRVSFKNFATRMIIVGLVPSSLTLVLSSQLVVSQVFGLIESLVVSGLVALLIAVFWWVLPLAHKKRDQEPDQE